MKRIIVGITGASGVIYGVRLLEVLRDGPVETHLILSDAAKWNIAHETDYRVEDVEKMAAAVYDANDMTAPVASGSYRTEGMVIAPCTIKTLSGVANSFTANLMIRAADVTLKERRRLVLMVRETPFHKGHLQLMVRAADLGAVILPPIPGFYHGPKSIADVIDHSVGKILDLFQIDHSLYRRWAGG